MFGNARTLAGRRLHAIAIKMAGTFSAQYSFERRMEIIKGKNNEKNICSICDFVGDGFSGRMWWFRPIG
jgi:hypothetical protein